MLGRVLDVQAPEVADQVVAEGNRLARQGQRVVRRGGRGAHAGGRAGVAGLGHGVDGAPVVAAEGVAEVAHFLAQHVFERGLGVVHLGADRRRVDLRQAHMADRVRAEIDPFAAQLANPLGRHQRRRGQIVRGEPAGGLADEVGDQIHQRRKTVPAQHRPGVFVEILVAVVEGEHHRARRRGPLAAQAGQRLVHAQHGVAEARQVGHLRGKAAVVAVGGAVRLHGRKTPDLVIHQDLDGVHGWRSESASAYSARVEAHMVAQVKDSR